MSSPEQPHGRNSQRKSNRVRRSNLEIEQSENEKKERQRIEDIQQKEQKKREQEQRIIEKKEEQERLFIEKNKVWSSIETNVVSYNFKQTLRTMNSDEFKTQLMIYKKKRLDNKDTNLNIQKQNLFNFLNERQYDINTFKNELNKIYIRIKPENYHSIKKENIDNLKEIPNKQSIIQNFNLFFNDLQTKQILIKNSNNQYLTYKAKKDEHGNETTIICGICDKIRDIIMIFGYDNHTVIEMVLQSLLPNFTANYLKHKYFIDNKIDFENLYKLVFGINESELLQKSSDKTKKNEDACIAIDIIQKNVNINKNIDFIYFKGESAQSSSTGNPNELAFLFPNKEQFGDAIVNYIVILEFLYLIDYNTKKENPDAFQIPIEDDDVAVKHVTLFEFNPTKLPFLINEKINRKNEDGTQRKKNSTETINNSQLTLKDEYLKKKFCLSNVAENDQYGNLKFHPLKIDNSSALTDYNLKQPYFMSYNIGTKPFQQIIKIQEIENKFEDSLINCFQEVINIQYLINGNRQQQKNRINVLSQKNFLSLGFSSKPSQNINKFVYDNKITNNNDSFQIPIYKYNDQKQFITITNRLASYEDDNTVKKNNVLFFPTGKVTHDGIFIGKLASGYQNNNMHTFTAIRIDNYVVINLHLDTDDAKRLKQLELEYLMKYIIPKYDFFTNEDVKKIYIMGDLNMDTYNIISTIYDKVNDKFYKNKTFKIVLNNIITRSVKDKHSALDNCIIIQRKSCNNERDPNIYVSHNSGTSDDKNLSDHSLIAFTVDNENNDSEMRDVSPLLESKISKSASSAETDFKKLNRQLLSLIEENKSLLRDRDNLRTQIREREERMDIEIRQGRKRTRSSPNSNNLGLNKKQNMNSSPMILVYPPSQPPSLSSSSRKANSV